ncbi:MAG TPA: carbohydrate kinase [Thermomicrobiales bacterium]|nr:carbohydrate kinase [Thermomicrobiales bacterium]
MAHSAPVLSFGELLIDLIATGSTTSLLDVDMLAVRPGGAPANVAVALARLGIPAALCSVVGQDPFGDRLLGVLDANGVDRSRVRQDPQADTTLAFAWKDVRGDGHFRLVRQADVLLNVDDVEAAGIADLAAIVVGSVSLSAQPSRRAIEVAVQRAREARVPVCFDVNLRPTIWPDRETARHACEQILPSTNLLKLSLDDARFLLDLGPTPSVDDVFAALENYAFDFIVLTDGGRGCWFANRETMEFSAPEHVPAYKIDAVEPTGAGDAFLAATIARLIEGAWHPLTVDDLRFASAAGALTTTRPGAIDSLPTRAEIDTFLLQHSS